MTPYVYPLHFGHLTWWQQLLVIVIAFGPFLILGAVVFVVRRQDLAAEEHERDLDQGDRAEPQAP